MKQLMKRGLSLVLVFVLIVSMAPGLLTPVSAAGYVANWGEREETAHSLSSYAKAFYTGENTYENFSAMEGSSTTSEVPNSELYKALQAFMKSEHSHITSYNETRDLYKYTDCQNGDYTSDGAISSFYSGAAIGPEWDGGDTWNREHTWPNSKGEGNAENDIMMLRPTAKSENSSRGNTAYGESSGYYNPNKVSNGAYDLRGDVARIMLYVYVRWGNTSKMWGTGGVMESREVLLKWMKADPVDTWELGRNDAVQSITGTRNVFVDYPELAFVLFGAEIPNYTTPSGEARKLHTSDYKITVTEPDAAMGSYRLVGKNLTVTPTAAYNVSEVKVTSGTATVTRDGNIFVIDAETDCTVEIVFQEKELLSVTLLENGTPAANKLEAYPGGIVTLPGATNIPEGYTFVGWVTAPYAENTVAPEYYEEGASYVVAASQTLYALYSKSGGETTESNVYALHTGAVTDGKYLIVSDSGAMEAKDNTGSANRLDYEDVDIKNDTITTDNADIIWYIDATGTDSNGKTVITMKNPKGYAASNSKKNNAVLSSTLDDLARWTVEAKGEGEFIITNIGTTHKNKTLRRNANHGFACYAASTGTGTFLYKQTAGTSASTIYSTGTEACKHLSTKEVAGKDATCKADGYTAGTYCNDCNTYISGHETIDQLKHNYEKSEKDGVITYTCSMCGSSYQANVITYKVPSSVAAVPAGECGASGLKMPTAETPEGFTFVGWVTDFIHNTDTLPETVYEAGETYKFTAPTTLRALYSYEVEADFTGENFYKPVTSVSELKDGAQLILGYNSSEYQGVATDFVSGKTYLGYAEQEFTSNNCITAPSADAIVFTLKGQAGAWELTYGGQALGILSDGNGKLAWDTADSTWIISISNGKADIENTNKNLSTRYLRANPSSKRFGNYKVDANTNYVFVPQLYIQSESGSVSSLYYSTVPCKFGGVKDVEQKEPTCTTDGREAGTACADCGTWLTGCKLIPATGHNYTSVVTNPTCTEDGYTTHTCSNCQDSYADTKIEAIGHNYTAVVTAPTCTTDGYTTYTCSNCNATYSGDIVKATGHKTELKDAQAATCTEKGYTGDQICSVCSETVEEGQEIPALGHKTELKNTLAATCTEKGYTGDVICSVCEEIISAGKEIPALGHNYGDSYKSDTDNHWQECTCGEKSESKKHTFGDWKVTKEATETKDGSKERTCSVCNYKQTQKIPATDSSSDTGDNTSLILLGSLLVISLAGILALVFIPKMKKQK